MPDHMIAELDRMGVIMRPPKVKKPNLDPVYVPIWDCKGECPF